MELMKQQQKFKFIQNHNCLLNKYIIQIETQNSKFIIENSTKGSELHQNWHAKHNKIDQ